MPKCVIENAEGRRLAAINIGNHGLSPTLWVSPRSSRAILFENEEMAQATVQFIGDVIDFELAEELEIKQMKEE